MPRIFDNIELSFLPTLQESLRIAERADFCVGYFNLRGWKEIAEHIDNWQGDAEKCCRLMVGMQSAPQDELRKFFSLAQKQDLDQSTLVRLKKQIAQEFREQLTFGIPTTTDETALRQLSEQIKSKKVIVKLFLKHQLHAKLYLVHRNDHNNPTIGFVGSSNLTFAGLSKQGELNVDVLDDTACKKLQRWFNARWDERWCLDISDELAEIIDTSWARKDLIPPYHIYLNLFENCLSSFTGSPRRTCRISYSARISKHSFRLPKSRRSNCRASFEKAQWRFNRRCRWFRQNLDGNCAGKIGRRGHRTKHTYHLPEKSCQNVGKLQRYLRITGKNNVFKQGNQRLARSSGTFPHHFD